MSNQNQTTRTCIACGQKKSLTAFLELSGNKIHSYGDTCASCRGTDLVSPKARDKESTEKSGGTTRFQLDNKMRVKTEQEKIQQYKHQEDLDYEEKTKKETLESKKTEKDEQHEETERKHREKYLVTEQPKTSTGKETAKAATSQKQKLKNFYQEKVQNEQKQSIEVTQNQNTTNQQEAKKITNDLSVAYLDEQTNTVKRSGSSIFAQFRKALGKSAAINRALEIYGQKNKEGMNKVKHSSGFLQEKAAQNSSTEKNSSPAQEFSNSNNNIKKR